MTTFQDAFNDAEAEVGGEGEALEGSPTDSGQADSEGAVQDSGTTEPTYFDLAAHGESLVQVKINGEVRDVALKDLPSGYMRQEAFTQKTQELAAERQELQAARTLAEAYAANPQETVRLLARQSGLTLAEAAAVAEDVSAEQGNWGTDSTVDPRMTQLDQRLAEIEAREARADLNRTLDDLGNRYGDSFKAADVVARAIQMQSTDLEGVYKQMAFDQHRAGLEASSQMSAAKATEDARIVAAKQSLGDVVSSGFSAAGAGLPGSAPITSIKQAAEAAFASSGFDFGD